MWKQRLGSDATYKKLIDIFESAGHSNYAEVVRNIICQGGMKNLETDNLHMQDDSKLLPQPETYPHHISYPLSPKFETQKHSFSDEFLLLNSAAVRDMPQGKNLILDLDSDSQ